MKIRFTRTETIEVDLQATDLREAETWANFGVGGTSALEMLVTEGKAKSEVSSWKAVLPA